MCEWYDVEKMEKVRLFLEEKLNCRVSKAVGKKTKCYSYVFLADGGKTGTLEIPRRIHDDNDLEGLLLKIEIQKALTKMKDKKGYVLE